MNNKLLCTILPDEGSLAPFIDDIKDYYTFKYDKIYILQNCNGPHLICTYSIDYGNVSHFKHNTVLVHRKKATNTLYTINALNTVIKQENNGRLDTKYPLNWEHYRNTVLIVRNGELCNIQTKLHTILQI